MRTGPAPKAVKHGTGGAMFTEVVNVPYDGPRPTLPKTTGVHWFPMTEAWWEVVTRMPHCVLWEESDWLNVIELAYMKNAWWGEYFGGNPPTAMAVEIRRREENLGMNRESRRKLLIRYVEPAVEYTEQPPVPDGENVTGIDAAPSRRARLAG